VLTQSVFLVREGMLSRIGEDIVCKPEEISDVDGDLLMTEKD
jgi:hypothetical protein